MPDTETVTLIDKAIEAAYQHGAEAYADLPPHPFGELDLFVLRKIPEIKALYDAVPFGFTRDDVDILRAVGRSRPEDTTERETLLSVADRIAALLPPRRDTP